MPDQTPFEARLTEAFARYAVAAPVVVDARALTRSLAAAHAARPSLGDRWAAAFGVRRMAPVLLLLLLALATAVAGALALRLLDRPARVFGAFEPIRGWAPEMTYDAAVALADGRLLVVEGSEGRAWLYDPSDGQSKPVGPLEPPRHGTRLVALPDGRALVIGGRVDGTVSADDVDLRTVVVFDSAAGSFREAGSTVDARAFPAAALLRDGRVLLVGGDRFEGVSDANQLLKIDPSDPTRQTAVSVGAYPRFLTVGGDAVWVMNQHDGSISRVSAAGTVLGTTRIADRIEGGDIAFGGGSVWVQPGGQLLVQLDPSSGEVVAEYGPRSGSGGVAADDAAVWVTAHDVDAVWRLPLR